MATEKNSTIIYHEWVFKYEDELTDEEFGLMFKAIAHYGQDGTEPVFADRGLRLIWNDIKREIDKNRATWEHTCEVKRENGKKGGRPRKKPETEENLQLSEKPIEKPKKTYRLKNGKNKTYENMSNEYMSNEYMSNELMINDIPPNNPPKGESLSLCADIIDYLNQQTGRSFKTNNQATVKLIKARIKEGYTLEDFKSVIDKKTRAWLKDPKMNDYLRPQTLFGTKFEGYLNEEWKPVTTKDIASSIDWTAYMD